MTISGILGGIVIGLIIGALGRLILPGKQNISLLLTLVVGVVAALLGSAIVGPLRDTPRLDIIEIVVQVALAAVGVSAVAALKGGDTR